MRAVLGLAGLSLREAWRSSILILLPIYAAYLVWVLVSYPAVDEQAHLRQALSFGHGALQAGVGLVCLLFGVSTVAADRAGRQADRTTSTPLGRGGYVLGKATALGGVALFLSLSLGGIEAALIRAWFSDLPDALVARPILRHSSFEITPASPGTDEPVHWIPTDRLSWKFRPEKADRLAIDGLTLGEGQEDGVRLRLRSPELGRSEILEPPLALPLSVPLPDWARGIEDGHLWVDLLHVSREEVSIFGDPLGACHLIGGGTVREPLETRGFLHPLEDGDGESRFQVHRGVWTYPAGAARRAEEVSLRPIAYGPWGEGASLRLLLQRGEAEEVIEVVLNDGRELTYPVPESIRQEEGELRVEITKGDPEASLGLDLSYGPDGAPRAGLHLSGCPIPQEWNLLLGAIAAASLGMLLGAAGMAASLCFSAPVALFAGSAFFVMGMGAGLFTDLPEPSGLNDPVAEVFGFESTPSSDLVRLAEKVSRVIPDLGRFDLKAPIVSFRGIPLSRVLGLVLYGVLAAGAFLGVGALVFVRWGSP